MITPSDIVSHLATYLPRVTDLFSINIGVSSATMSGGNILTVNTAAAHGLVTGAAILFKSGQTPNTVASVAEETEDETLRINFTDVQDFTTPNVNIVTEPLPVVGFNEPEWNVTLEIIEVVDDGIYKSVIVNFPSGASGVPTFTPGNAIGYEERPLSIFGIQTVASTPTTTQFTVVFDSLEVPAISDGDLINVTATTAVRVAAADNIDRADAIYADQTNQDDLWLFVIMTNTDVSKDRHSLNDGLATFSHQDEMRLRVLQNFSLVVYFKTADSISGATAQELAYGTIYENLLGVLYGFNGFAKEADGSSFVAVTAGHGQGTSNVAYYTQVYDWQLPVDITVANGFDMYEDTAFRKIDSSFGMFTTDNEEQLTLAINLKP